MSAVSARLKKSATATALAASLLAGAGTALVAAPTPAAAADCAGKDGVGGGNCTSALIGAVADTVKFVLGAANQAKMENAQFTQALVSKLSSAAPGYNVLVFKYDGTDAFDTKWFKNDYSANMRGVMFEDDVKLEHHDKEGGPQGYDDFKVWVFAGESTFVNYGDGGFMNWAFIGHDSDTSGRGGRLIHFPARVVPGSSSGSTPPPGTPSTPQVPIGGQIITVPAIPISSPGTPGIPAHETGDTGTNIPGGHIRMGFGVADSGAAQLTGTLHPSVKNGRAPAANGSASGTPVTAATSTAGKSTGWVFSQDASGLYKITNAVTGLALTENTKSYLAEARPWTGSAAQKWEVFAFGDGEYQIRVSTDDCLTYDEDNKVLGVWTCTNDWNQRWTIKP
ncbi:RICIN domain-containing protein [Kitasatospora sp. NPDC056800]|uniref:RICIN domain-containing protein n=1 Tax=Kitasatospora sp. NPDC056800 TaxID=3345948 RepID=UPI00368B96C6